MAIFRVHKSTNFVVMSKTHLKDTRLSLKAKGLLSQMLSLPDDWDYSISGLASINKESEGTIKVILEELKKHNYLVVTKKLPNETQSGRIEYLYDIYEEPYEEKQEGKKQGVVFQGVEKQGVVFCGQYNNNILNNKILNNNNIKESKKESFDDLINSYTSNEELRAELKNHLATRKAKKATLTNRAIELSFKTLDKLARDDKDKLEIVRQSIERGWTGFFEIKKTREQINKEEMEKFLNEIK